MAAGDTARLIASLELQDKFTPTSQKALGSLNQLETKVASAGKGLGTLGAIGSKGLSNLAGNLAKVGVAAGAVLGVGGILGVSTAIEGSITKVRDFGEQVDKTASLTGLATDKASALASALQYVGVDSEQAVKMMGMAEKNLGNLAGTAEKAAAFQKQFGMSLVDSNGQMVDANELLLRSADLYTSKNIPAATKALALSKIYGRSWQENIELFELGREKIAQVEAEMAAFGLTMTPENMRDWERFRDVSRESTSAIAGLQLQLGLLVLPDLVSGMTQFVDYVKTHQADIKRFFADGIKTAKEFGSFLTGTVIPAIKSIAETAKTVWNLIPAPMQQLLVGGFIANKLTGGAVADLVGLLGKGLIKGVLGITAGIVNINAASIRGLPVGGAAPGGAAGGGTAAFLGAAAISAIAGAVVFAFKSQVLDPGLDAQSKSINEQVAKQIAGGASLADLQTSLDAVNKGITDLSGKGVPGLDILGDVLFGQQKTDLENARKALEGAMAQRYGPTQGPPAPGSVVPGPGAAAAANRDTDRNLGPVAAALRAAADAMKGSKVATLDQKTADSINRVANQGRDIINAMRGGLAKLDPKAAIKAASDIVKVYSSGTAKDLRWIGANEAKVADLAAKFDRAGDHVTAASLRGKLEELKRIQATWGQKTASASASTTAAAKQQVAKTQAVHDRLAKLNATESTANTKLERIAQKKWETSVTVPVSVTTTVSVRNLDAAATTSARWGKVVRA